MRTRVSRHTPLRTLGGWCRHSRRWRRETNSGTSRSSGSSPTSRRTWSTVALVRTLAATPFATRSSQIEDRSSISETTISSRSSWDSGVLGFLGSPSVGLGWWHLSSRPGLGTDRWNRPSGCVAGYHYRRSDPKPITAQTELLLHAALPFPVSCRTDLAGVKSYQHCSYRLLVFMGCQ